ncbi:Flagellar hook-associated protein FlgK [hydrothermal vent metagenome]|uniref:Flagellar hook-associated protein FlgK n=1 Tax=hydrothermal vent metagenome TaxID=652676 RepID=A0A3B1DJX1_9ZZZZ
MSLTAAMLIGRSGLSAAQTGVQVAANNIANASTPGYSRQVLTLEPTRGSSFGGSGAGVSVTDIRRQVSAALQGRLWTSQSEQAAAGAQLDSLSTLEASLQELTGNDLSSELAGFFGAWSEAANLEQSNSVVVQQGQRLADFVGRIRRDVLLVREQIQSQMGGLVTRANELLEQIAEINTSIARTERGKPNANELRDQRDMLVTSLSEIVDTTIVEQPDGQFDVHVAGTPIVLGGRNLGIDVRQDSDGSQLTSVVMLKTNGQPLNVTGGIVGGLLASRDIGIGETLETLDTIAAQLAFEVNKLHSTGISDPGMTSMTGLLGIPTADRTIAMNSSLNATFAGLPYSAENGGFFVNVKNQASGLTQSVRIDVDLDGLTNTGEVGFDDDTSAEDIRAALSGVDNLTATFAADGKLRITADEGYEVSFSDDTSGALAVLGVNAFYEGTTAADLAVRSDLLDDPTQLATGRMIDDTVVANGTALAIAGLQDAGLEALNGETLLELWGNQVQTIAVNTEYASDRLESTGIVRQSLEAQRAGASGVSIDEESINLINYQRQYEGSARIISVARDLLDTLLRMV